MRGDGDEERKYEKSGTERNMRRMVDKRSGTVNAR